MVRLVQDMTGDHPARPVLVASNDPEAGGLIKAAEMGVPTAAVDHRQFRGDRPGFEAALLAPLLAAEPDVICLAGFMRILTPDFVQRFAGRMLNIHPSLLPKYPGLNTRAAPRATAFVDRHPGPGEQPSTPMPAPSRPVTARLAAPCTR